MSFLAEQAMHLLATHGPKHYMHLAWEGDGWSVCVLNPQKEQWEPLVEGMADPSEAVVAACGKLPERASA